jgi:O-antigen ligase
LTKPSPSAGPWALRFLAAAVLLGGLRDPRLAAAGEAAVFTFVWLERPALGPAAAWIPWLAWAFLSGAAGLQPIAAFSPLARWSAVLAFFSLAATWGAIEREDWIKLLLSGTGLIGAAALWTGVPYGFRAEMTGLLPPYYNYTTFFLSAGVAAGAAWALHPRTSRTGFRRAGLAAAAFGTVCLILAHGRGAQLGVATAAIIWAARRWGAKAGLVGIVAVGLAAGAFQSGFVPASWRSDLVHHGARYEGARLDIWRGCAATATDWPWLGAGPGSFGVAFLLHPAEAIGGAARWGLSTEYAHSEVLQSAAETGWAGAALWLIGLGFSFSFLLGRANDEPAREAAAIAAVAMGVHLTVDNMLQIPGLALVFFSSLAVAGAGPMGGRRWPRAVAGGGIALALVAWIPRFIADGNPSRAAVIFPRDSSPWEDLAYHAMSDRDLPRADALWAQAEERAPFDAIYPWRRAQISAAQGRWDAAERFATRAAELEPFFLNDRVLRAEAMRHLERTAEARAELASVRRTLVQRGDRPRTRGYETVIWDFDRKEFDRVAGLTPR